MRGFEEVEEGLPPPAGAHIKAELMCCLSFWCIDTLDVQHDGFMQLMNERSERTVCEVYQSLVQLLLFGGGFTNIRESSAVGDVPYDSPLCQHKRHTKPSSVSMHQKSKQHMSSAFHALPRRGWLPIFEPPHEVTTNLS